MGHVTRRVWKATFSLDGPVREAGAPLVTDAPPRPFGVIADDQRQVTIEAYKLVAARRVSYDVMLWRVPALTMAAHAFLLRIALGDARMTSRIIAASLAALMAGMCLQLMAKHRALEIVDSFIASQYEDMLGVNKLNEVLPHSEFSKRLSLKPECGSWLASQSSYRIWMVGIFGFLIADIGIVLFSTLSHLLEL